MLRCRCWMDGSSGGCLLRLFVSERSVTIHRFFCLSRVKFEIKCDDREYRDHRKKEIGSVQKLSLKMHLPSCLFYLPQHHQLPSISFPLST